MICKKCGKEIAQTAKFCGYCGNPVDEPQINQEIPMDQNLNENVDSMTGELGVEVENNNLNVNDAVQEINEQPTNETIVNNSEIQKESSLTELNDNTPTFNTQNTYMNMQQVINNVNTELNTDEQPDDIITEKKSKKTNSKLIIIISIIGASLLLLGLFLFIKFSPSRNSISILSKAVENFKTSNNATINASLTMETKNDEKINLSGTLKYNKNGDIGEYAFKLNKSLFLGEVNIYGKSDKQNMNLYIESKIVDMLGFTMSPENIWINLNSKITEEQTTKEYDLKDIVDSKHFKYIDSKNGLKHYQLTIDNELIEKAEKLADEEKINDIKNKVDSVANVDQKTNKTYMVDIYINSSNEFQKIELDLTQLMDKGDYKKALISMEARDFNNTSVEISSEATNYKYDMNTYMSTFIKK